MNRLLAYLQLMRLPNVFTAMADVFMGFLIARGTLAEWREFLPLLAASSAIYLGGMVWNDWFDIEVDRAERPGRPLPSGRVPVRHALVLGVVLLAAGLAAAVLAGPTSRNVAALLVVSVLLYDGALKGTVLGPIAMGACRALNVLLGLSSVPNTIWLPGHEQGAARFGTMVAAGLGLYVMGVTRFARREAEQSPRVELTSTTLGINLGLLLLAMTAPHLREWTIVVPIEPMHESLVRFAYPTAVALWLSVVLATNAMVWRALIDSQPSKIQAAVKTCIMAIIAIDAAVVALVCGPIWAVAVLVLLLPSLTLGRWVYST
jgi:4-hydroxybenzoate polyprenyltransferase